MVLKCRLKSTFRGLPKASDKKVRNAAPNTHRSRVVTGEGIVISLPKTPDDDMSMVDKLAQKRPLFALFIPWL